MKRCPPLRRLSAEHVRWRAEAAALAGTRAPEDPGRLVALWEEEILPHCRFEEEVLLPELSRLVSEADALIVFTLGDHLVLRRLARELRAASGPRKAEAAARLASRLEEHFAYEDQTLFPAMQEALGSARLGELAHEDAAAGRNGKHRPVDVHRPRNEATRQTTERKDKS